MRKLQLPLAYFGSAFLLVTLISEAGVLIGLAGFIYLSVYCFVVSDLVRSKQMTFSMNLFLIFFGVGHVIKTAFVLLNKEIHQEIGWLTIGTFDFSIEAMSSLFLVELSTLLGGYICIKQFIKKRKVSRDVYFFTNSKNRSKGLLLAWCVLSVLLIALIDRLGFGQHGVQPGEDAALPYGIGGFLVYFRNVAIPALGLVFLQWYLYTHAKRRWVGYLAYILVALAFSIYSLSRSAFIIATIPLVLIYLSSRRISLKRVAISSLIAFVFVVSMAAVNEYRLTIYNADVDASSAAEVVLNAISVKQVLVIAGFIVDRIEGSRELMAVMSSDIKGLSSLFDVFYYGSSEVMESVMGFVPASEGMAFGITYGLSGLLFIGGSYLVVFFGTIAYLAALFAIERLFLNRGYVMASMYISFVIFVNIWGNMVWFFFVRFFFMAIFAYFIIRFIEKFILIQRPKRLAQLGSITPGRS